MAVQIFPTPVTTISGASANAFTIPSALTLYKGVVNVATGVYTVTCVNTTVATVKFFSGTTEIAEVVTVSGTVTYNLGTACDTVFIFTDTGSNVVVTLTKTADAISVLSGTLDTITTSSTYNQTGRVWVLVVGGGGAGGGKNAVGTNIAGGGGGGGGIWSALTTLNTATTVTIGAGGNVVGNGTSNAGGATTFGNLTANGGGAGVADSGGAGAAGTGNTGGGNATGGTGSPNTNSATGGGQNNQPYNFVKGQNGGGGGGGFSSDSKPGGGTTIGVGGNGGGGTSNAGTGYGAGGGGKNATNFAGPGGAGTAGVVYVLRGLF